MLCQPSQNYAKIVAGQASPRTVNTASSNWLIQKISLAGINILGSQFDTNILEGH